MSSSTGTSNPPPHATGSLGAVNAFGAEPTPVQVIAGLRATSDGGGDLVQLLTPEGQRVIHPGFDLEVTADEIKSLYRDMVLVRRFDREANALQRQVQLGLMVMLLGK